MPAPLWRSAAAAAVLPTPAAAVTDPEPGTWTTIVDGAVNPLVGTPFQVNGGGATPLVRFCGCGSTIVEG